MRQLARWEFDIYALSLPRGHGFGNKPPNGAWMTDDGNICGILTSYLGDRPPYGYRVMRRRRDLVFTLTGERSDFSSREEAAAAMHALMPENSALEPVPPGI